MIVLISILVSIAICFAIAKFAKSTLWVAILVLIFQFGGYVIAVETGDMFNDYSFLNLAIVATLSFIWFLVAAQMHSWVKSKELENSPNNKGLENG